MSEDRVLILTALEGPERQEVLKLIHNAALQLHPVTRTDYYVGSVQAANGPVEVIVGRTDQTNVNAGIETERAINYFKPKYVFFIGVAGGLKDVNIGDVVIGKDVYGYERGKDTEAGFLPRPAFGFSTYELERVASSYSYSVEWQTQASYLSHPDFPWPVNILTGTIAVGEKVNASEKSQVHQFLRKNCSHALAVEMEGLGFLEASRHHPHLKVLLVRGISDLVENKSASDGKGSQNYATRNAATFVLGIIKFLYSLETQSPSFNNSSNQDIKPSLLKFARELYPEGIKQDAIWLRAGGDLSAVSIHSMNGRTQWFEALNTIQKGGGGSITFAKLVAAMREDYPHHPQLKKFTDQL